MALKNKAPITPLGFEVQFCKKLTQNMKNKKKFGQEKLMPVGKDGKEVKKILKDIKIKKRKMTLK